MNEYRHRMGIFQEILRLHAEEELEGAARFWMKQTRPPEELYDITEDPHEINNLADDPAYREELERMRGALDQWMDERLAIWEIFRRSSSGNDSGLMGSNRIHKPRFL
ncbi:MAG: hypothetical protein U5K69_23195 [Balneolaceae bacterium]|nr:hypothetical protein [Balneolaceae bacterium]